MWKEGVDVSITGNSTNPTRFQHPVAGTYKKERVLAVATGIEEHNNYAVDFIEATAWIKKNLPGEMCIRDS